MKTFNFLVLILTMSGYLSAQISINNTSFPGVGTELKYFFVGNPNPAINQGSSGANITYDFSLLTGGSRFSEKYQAVAEGKFKDSFPDANVLLINTMQTGGEQYGKVLNSRIEIVGFGGQNPILGGETAIAYKKRPQIRRSPMYYETTGFSEGTFALAFPSTIIPDTLLNSFPIKPDSLRISISSVNYDTIDGWGKLRLKNKEFEVLREKSVVLTSNILEIKIFGGWLDVSTFIGNNIPGGTGFEGFGKDTTTYYRFYTNTRKDILVTVETNNDNEVNSIEYADVAGTSANEEEIIITATVVFPNPAQEVVTLRNPALIPGNYRVTILDVDGKVMSNFLQTIHTPGEISVQVAQVKPGFHVLIVEHAQQPLTLKTPLVIAH